MQQTCGNIPKNEDCRMPKNGYCEFLTKEILNSFKQLNNLNSIIYVVNQFIYW